jgi:hypothetical protein
VPIPTFELSPSITKVVLFLTIKSSPASPPRLRVMAVSSSLLMVLSLISSTSVMFLSFRLKALAVIEPVVIKFSAPKSIVVPVGLVI